MKINKFKTCVLLLLLLLNCKPNANYDNSTGPLSFLVELGDTISNLSSNSSTNGITVSNSPTSITENQSVDIGINFTNKITENKTITITSSNPAITVNGSNTATLTFTSSNGTVAQKITLKAEDDLNRNPESVKITISSSGFSDVILDINTVDDDTLNISLSGSTSINEGSAGTVNVSLTFTPDSDMTVTLTSQNTNSLTLNPSSLTFTSANYNIPQLVTLNAITDSNKLSETVTISASAPGVTTQNWNVQTIDHIQGTIIGLNGGSVVLQNNGGDDLTVSADGTFSFPTPSTTYNIDIKHYTLGKVCINSSNSGSNISTEPVISIKCSIPYSTGGSSFGLVATGQTTVKTTGDDASNASLFSRKLKDNGDGTVTDYLTGLTWQKCGMGQNSLSCSGTSTEYTSKSGASNACTTLGLAAKTWRLPNVQELASLIDMVVTPPVINKTLFPSTITGSYWTNQSNPLSPTNTILLSFDFGQQVDHAGTGSAYLRCVTGAAYSPPTYTDNGDGTIKDNSTGLVWQKCSKGKTYNSGSCTGTIVNATWNGAISYCSNLSLGSRTWRLPNRNELLSLVDYSKTNGYTINETYFSDTIQNEYWTSTYVNVIVDAAFGISFQNGVLGGNSVGINSSARCVSGPDVQSIVITGASTVAEGASGTINVKLAQIPTSNITVNLASNDTNTLTLASSTLTFTPANYNINQSVNINALQDVNDISETVSISATATDVPTKTWNVTCNDDDVVTQNITLTESASRVEGSNFTISVTLSGSPISNRTVNFSSNNNPPTISPSSLTFTAANWNIAQNITVTGLLDSNSTTTITASGTNLNTATKNISNVKYTISGTVYNLTGSVTLANKSLESKTISSNGTFSFTNPSSTYNVTVSSVSSSGGKVCTPVNGSGTATSAVSNIKIYCYHPGGSALGLLATGQTTSYATGDDGNLKLSIPRSYTDNGNATITDNVTKLVWLKCTAGISDLASCTGTAPTANWANAGAYCSGISGGPWRLPNIYELATLLESTTTTGVPNPTYFPGNVSGGSVYYWSSSQMTSNANYILSVLFDYGQIHFNVQSNNAYVRCVSGAPYTTPTYTDNGNGTITANSTGLVWQKCTMGQNNDSTCSGTATQGNWSSAMSYCSSLSLGSRTWRVPNKNEMLSLIDYTAPSVTAINATYFPNTIANDAYAQYNQYWTSTGLALDPINYVWPVGFYYGFVLALASSNYPVKTNTNFYYTRCVSGP